MNAAKVIQIKEHFGKGQVQPANRWYKLNILGKKAFMDMVVDASG